MFDFDRRMTSKVLTKFWQQCWSFCMNRCKRNNGERHFVPKKALFSILIPPLPVLNKIIQKL